MRRILMTGLAVAACMVACHEQPREDDMAAQTAKTYYDMLVKGQYELFVDGTYRPDSIPASYREQLIANAKMYIGQQRDEHGGIVSVKAIGSQIDTARKAGNAFVELVYADSVHEQVAVPMVCHGGVWYMR